MKLKALMGSGDKIMLFTLPFLAIGAALNFLYPAAFHVGGPSPILRTISIIVLLLGVIVWLWSVFLILAKVPRNELITSGPFALVKHPLYTGVSLLVLPWAGFLIDTWLGALVGCALYTGSRLFSKNEEKNLSKSFGAAYTEYVKKLYIPWL